MKLYLALMSVLVGLLGVASVIPALFSVMMFDAPGSSENPATIALFLAVASFPIVCICAIVGAWKLHRARKNGLAGIMIWLPALNAFLGLIAVFCLQTFYNGKFKRLTDGYTIYIR